MQPFPSPDRNDLIAALSPAVKRRLSPMLRCTRLSLGQVIYEAGQEIAEVWFPTEGIISLLNITADGDSTEICVVGREGAAGTAVLLGSDRALSTAIVQSAGTVCCLPAQALKREFDQDPGLRMLLLRYMQSLFIQLTQTAVCNRHHNIDQQLCRWLLLSLDRLPDNEVHITQALIADMLGVRREGVTEAAHKLKELGVIAYRRGHITVLDRSALEEHCCECYSVVRTQTERLLGLYKKN